MDTVEELLGLLRQQTEINTELVRGQQDALIDGNIAKSPGGSTFGQKVSPKLTSTEVRRTTEASNIFVKAFFDAEKRLKPDKKEKTLTSQLYKRSDKAKNIQSGNGKKEGSSIWDSVLSAFGLGAAAWALLKDKFKKFVAGFATKIKNFIGRVIEGLGSIWSKIKNSRLVKSLGRFFSNIISRISSFVKGVVSRIGKVISSLWSGIKKIVGKITKSITKVVSKIGETVSNLWGKVVNSDAYKFFTEAIDSAINSIKNFFVGLKNKLAEILAKAIQMAKDLIPKGAQEFIGKGASAVKGVASKAGSWWDIAKNVGSKAWSGVKSTAGAVGEAVVEGGAKAGKLAVQGAKAVGEFALEPAKATVRSAASGAIKGAGGMMKMLGKLAKLPILGPLIEGAFTAYDIKGLKEKYEKGEITLEELQAQSGRRVIQGVGAVGGSALGTFLGAAAGSIIPVAGNVVGGILGAIGGDMLGRFVGDLVNDYLLPPKYSKTIGAFVTGTAPPPEEMQDFIIRGNQVYKFSNKDEVLGMKSGGAIDQFLGSQQGGNGMGLLVKTANTSNLILQGIERNTRELLKVMGGKAGGGVTVVNQNSPSAGGSAERPTSSVSNNRLGYSSSPYTLA